MFIGIVAAAFQFLRVEQFGVIFSKHQEIENSTFTFLVKQFINRVNYPEKQSIGCRNKKS